MRKMKLFLLPFFMMLLSITLTSSVPTEINKENDKSQEVSVDKDLKNENKADVALSYSELKKVAEEFKGEKLTFKEKIALKVFGKKIANNSAKSGGGKSQLIALLLVLLVGGLGIHRFYLGYTWQGIVQLLTLGGCGIWALIDLIRIVTGDLTPKDGSYDKTL